MNENAKVTRVEVVNGDMLSVTTDSPDFGFESVSGYLNGSGSRFNTWDMSLDIKPGDEITPDGEIVEGAERGATEATEISGPVARWDSKLDN